MLKKLLISPLILLALTIPARAATIDELGPQSNATTTSDPGTANILQPAGPSLQSTPDQASQLQQPGQNNDLQPAGSSTNTPDIRQLLAVESDGMQKSPATDDQPFINIWWFAPTLFLVGAFGGYWWDRRSQRRQAAGNVYAEIGVASTELESKPAPAQRKRKAKGKKRKS